MRIPTKQQKERLLKQTKEDKTIDECVQKVDVAIAISQAIVVLMFVLILGYII